MMNLVPCVRPQSLTVSSGYRFVTVVTATRYRLLLDGRIRAVEQRDAHRDRPDVEVLLENHPVRLKNFRDVDHFIIELEF